MAVIIPGDTLKLNRGAFAVRHVHLAQAVHPTIPGKHMSVHATMKGAKAESGKSLNLLRSDYDLKPVKTYTQRSVEATKRAVDKAGDDPDGADVWIETFMVAQ